MAAHGKRFAIFYLRVWLQLRMSRILFAAKRIVGSYLQVMRWDLGQ